MRQEQRKVANKSIQMGVGRFLGSGMEKERTKQRESRGKESEWSGQRECGAGKSQTWRREKALGEERGGTR
jgi:hypothetical protein